MKRITSAIALIGFGAAGQASAMELEVGEAILQYVNACYQKGGASYLNGQPVDAEEVTYLVQYARQIADMNAMMSGQAVQKATPADAQKYALMLQADGSLQCSAGPILWATQAVKPVAVPVQQPVIPAIKKFSSESQKLPFIGEQYVNFYGGSGTAESLTITSSGRVRVASARNNSFIFEGKYSNPLQISPETAYLFKDNGVYVLENGSIGRDCTGTGESCFQPLESKKIPWHQEVTRYEAPEFKSVNFDKLDFDFYCSWSSPNDKTFMVGVGDGYNNVVINYKGSEKRLSLQTEESVDENYQLLNDFLDWKSDDGSYNVSFGYTDKSIGAGILTMVTGHDRRVEDAELYCRD